MTARTAGDLERQMPHQGWHYPTLMLGNSSRRRIARVRWSMYLYLTRRQIADPIFQPGIEAAERIDCLNDATLIRSEATVRRQDFPGLWFSEYVLFTALPPAVHALCPRKEVSELGKPRC
jgi:hypothetical protein